MTWATNGFAGFVKLISGKFSINADRGLLKPQKENINISYIKYKIEPILRKLAKGRKGENGEDEFTKVYPSMIEDIEFPMPIDENGNFDISAQEELAEKYEFASDVKAKIAEYQQKINNLSVKITDAVIETVSLCINDLFEIKSGNSKLTQKYLNTHKGNYVVYSANTKQNGVFGYIDTYDYDIECIQLTTNGVYAGTFFYREKHKFSINGDARLLIRKNDNLYYCYLMHKLEEAFAVHSFNWENKPSIRKIETIQINIPVSADGNFDLSAQK
ncbi:MAG: hypothetical protein Ta2A_12920 [Treponemataceae bacterium]|nr:MAG: hypothetical protein Ta2A_12920 [Treponemataceae bacterium]